MELGVRDRGYLIVGGTAGLGLAAAAVLAADGARVAIAGRNPERAEKAAASIGTGVSVITGDVTDERAAQRIAEEAAQALGGLAGIAITTGTSPAAHSDPEHATEEVWAETFQDILMGTVRSVQAAIPYLKASGGGTIVTTAAYSIHAYHPARTPYITLKSGVAAYTKMIARAYGKDGIRANCVCPGAIESAALASMRQRLAAERGVPPEGLLEKIMVEEWHMQVGLGRPGKPEEVGDLFAFLLSPRAGYLTGAVINIDGGTEF